MPTPDLHADFRALNEAAHRAAKSARRSSHPQASALTMLAAYTDMIVDGAAPRSISDVLGAVASQAGGRAA